MSLEGGREGGRGWGREGRDDCYGSFHVKSSGDFHGPPPILLKFGTRVGIV